MCVGIGVETKPQGVENRFCLRVTSAAEVDAARDTALRLQGEHKIKKIGPIEVHGNVRSFMLCDRDTNWWEISNTSGATYDEAFARGDVSA